MPTARQILALLKKKAHPGVLSGLDRFGIPSDKRLGVTIPETRKIAKTLGTDHRLALALWKTGVPDARILASMVADPERLSSREMESWVKDFDAWDVCDQVCMNLFSRSPLAWKKIKPWANDEREFVKRAGFVLIAILAWHDKNSPDKTFVSYFSLLKKGAKDERNFVKKAVNWALRGIGKRKKSLHAPALRLSRELAKSSLKSTRWVGQDALRELESAAIRKRLAK